MVQKSHGPRHRSRHKMQAGKRITPNKHLEKFEKGDIVHVGMVPSIKGRGYPYIRFKGKTGKVMEKRGDAYIISVTDKNATKSIILKAVHLKKAEYKE